ncbi:MAG: methionine--tRNA ligase, partial [Candidatus Woesearchaeota archaeon]|nr:methionine--tRNA ligase [Candidatus Woesearchaeota archaeon]
MAKKYYITTAIDYVNSKPHLGHAYEKIIADFLARWHRQRGEDVFYLTGTDENAEKNEEAAKEAGVPVKEFVDKNSQIFKELCTKLSISNDDFIRTTSKKHFDVSQSIFQTVYDKKEIYKGEYQGYYCVGCEAFLTEIQLKDGKCPEHDREPDVLKEESYFFSMSKYTDKIKKLLEKGLVEPEHWRNDVLSRVKNEGLKDLSVSRINRDWGIDVPFDKKHKIYVWFDALINYLSGIDYPSGKLYKKYWPADVHVIGKGINWFHSVIWPSMLLSAGIPVPKTVLVHGYVNLKGKKMSKSIGDVVDPLALADDYGADALRYFLLREIPFGGDGDFSEEALVIRYNNELANDLGNLLKRIQTLLVRNEREGFQCKCKDELLLLNELKKADKLIDTFKINDALDIVWKAVVKINGYLNKKEPWKIKDDKELDAVLYNVLESLRFITSYLEPLIPVSAQKIADELSFKILGFDKLVFGKGKFTVTSEELLFPKVDLKEEEKFLLNLKIGKILSAEEHPEADKLLVLQVDLGSEKRQLVAGLKGHYALEDLKERNIVVITNLKPAKLRGVESQGMLLAASDE